jgi:hypothetical protein
MRVDLFGVGTLSESRAITAQKRINCQVEVRREQDRTTHALTSRAGLKLFVTPDPNNPSRGMRAVNSLSAPLLFTVHANTLYSVNTAGTVTAIGAIGSTTGDVSLSDDGTYLVFVDGAKGYVYNMIAPAGITQITDGNFTTSPRTVTWQDNYFIVTSRLTRQWQLSQISPSINPLVWPAVQIGFASSGSGSLQGGIASHSMLNLFGDTYAEFWQDAGSPDLPYTLVQGAGQEYGLAAPFSLQRFDNALIGLFKSREGGLNVSRVQGFSFKKVSDHDLDEIIAGYSTALDAEGISYNFAGHPCYILNFPTAGKSWLFDGYSNVWSELTSSTGVAAGRYLGNKSATLNNSNYVSDYANGNIYLVDSNNFTDNSNPMTMEVWSKHIWKDDKYIGIIQIQIDIESGVGLVSGQGSQPVCDLQVSKDGGFTFNSIGFSSMGLLGDRTARLKWNSLGAARDWVLKLVITDPVKRVITGASAEVQGGGF